MPGKVRRIVTGVNAAGRSYIVSDTLFPTTEVKPDEPVRVGLWTTDSAPASNKGVRDPVPDGVILRTPPAHRGGSVIRITDIAPDARGAYGPGELSRRGCKTTPARSARHPGFHATDTVDYAICLEGEVWAVLDEAETLMRPGDVLIQRGTYHAWSNRSDRICRMAFILIDAEPLDNH
ncbi:MAG TPA: cupin domain-containing protein [Candidatus Methylomirabilis sp.]|nr:cupin domain-containing protein [Candidatus Methylomirabilis sp.]